MKKTMILGAAALAGLAAMAVESSVVGYDQTSLRFGAKGAGASFVPVSGAETISIQELSITGYEGESLAEATAQTLDFAGRTLEEFSWYDFVDGGDTFYGWYDTDGELATLTFAPGEGLYLVAPDATYSLQSKGKVPTSNIAVQLRFGAKHVVNPTPVEVNVNDENGGVWISGYEGESLGDVTMQVLDFAGRTVVEYAWYDFTDGGETYYGWFDTDGEKLTDVTMAPGVSMYFVAPSNSYYVNFKGVTVQ